jgi:hypothetical protein
MNRDEKDANEPRNKSTAKPRKTTSRMSARQQREVEAGGAPADAGVRAAPPADIEAPLPSPAADGSSEPMTTAASTGEDGPTGRTDGLEEVIRIRAYELYVSRGGADGDDLSDWLEAERSVRADREPRSGRSNDARADTPPPS